MKSKLRAVIDVERLQQALGHQYAIEREIARGGMGTVYLASERHPRRTVAIKVFNPAVSARIGEARFHREIELAGNLAHPGVVAIYAAGEADGLLYYVMPYIEGETLRDRLDREAPLPISDTLSIVRDVADALEYAHRRNVIHRDIKPQNILLHAGRAFVTDFGVAKAVYGGSAGVLTEEGHSVGTPEYMSPEQILGKEQIDARTDVYALGCVVYEMLGGEPPFRGNTLQATLARQLSDTASPLRVLRQTIPDAVDLAVAGALAKIPADRFSSVADFCVALFRAVDAGDSLRFTTPTPRQLATPQPRARLRTLGFVAAVGVTVLAGVLLATRVLNPPTSRTPNVPIAVRAVVNMTGEPGNNATADLLTADLIDQLHRIPQLHVKDRSSSVALSALPLTTRQFADCLAVAYVIEPYLQQDGEAMMLKANLADGSGNILRPAIIERRGREFMHSGPRDVATVDLIKQLLPGLPVPVEMAGMRRPEQSPARDFVLTGNRELAKRTFAGMRAALALFDSAVALDPDYAEGYAQLSKTYALGLVYRYRLGIVPYEAAGLSLASADRAIRLKPEASHGYAARGYIGRFTYMHPDSIAADFDAAKRIDPNAADAVAWSALALARAGYADSALAEVQRAIQIDKYSSSRWISATNVAVRAHRYDLAFSFATKARRLSPSLMLARVWWARASLLAGRPEECASMDAGPHAAIRAACLRAIGRKAEAQHIVDSMEQAFDRGTLGDSVWSEGIRLEDLATYHATSGDAARAALWLERAFQTAPNGIEENVLESALFDSVRNDPAFRTALDRSQRWVRERVRDSRGAAGRRFRM